MVSYVIDWDIWLYDLGGVSFSYLSDIPFEQLDNGYKIECRLGMIFDTWYIVMLLYAALVI